MKFVFRAAIQIALISLILTGCSNRRGNLATVKSSQKSERKVELGSWGNGGSVLTAMLPNEFTSETSHGPDFDIHRIFHKDGDDFIGIYVGHNPNLERKKGAGKIRKRVGRKTVVFERIVKEDGNFFEAVIPGFFETNEGSGVSDLILHIFINAKDDRFYDDAWSILRSLSLSHSPRTLGPSTSPG